MILATDTEVALLATAIARLRVAPEWEPEAQAYLDKLRKMPANNHLQWRATGLLAELETRQERWRSLP